jgi:hypothetical protein
MIVGLMVDGLIITDLKLILCCNYSKGNYSDGNYSDGNYSDGNYSDGNYSDGNYSDRKYFNRNYYCGELVHQRKTSLQYVLFWQFLFYMIFIIFHFFICLLDLNNLVK